MATMHLLDLNHDVLSLILSHLSPSALLAFALTSRTAHDAALPHLLAAPIIGGTFYASRARGEASGPRQLTAFCTSVLAHPARAHAVRQLTVRRDAFRAPHSSAHAPAPALVALLARALARTRSLHAITLWNLAALLDAHPALSTVLASLPNLHNVRLGGEIPSADALLAAFPHATDLCILDGARFAGTDTVLPAFAEIDQSRTSPHAHAPARRPAGRTLDRLSLPAPLLPLALPVRCLELRTALAPASAPSLSADIAALLANLRTDDAEPDLAALPPAAAHALALVARTRPVVLRAAVDARLPAHAFVALLPRVAPQLRVLELIREASADTETDAESAVEWMNHTAAALAPLPLAALALRLSSPARPRAFLAPRPAPPPSPPPSHAPSPAHTRASTPAPASCARSRAATPALKPEAAPPRAARAALLSVPMQMQMQIAAPVPRATCSRAPVELAAQALHDSAPSIAVETTPSSGDARDAGAEVDMDADADADMDMDAYTDTDKPRTLPALAHALAKAHHALRFVALDRAACPASSSSQSPASSSSSPPTDPFAPRAFGAAPEHAEDPDAEMAWFALARRPRPAPGPSALPSKSVFAPPSTAESTAVPAPMRASPKGREIVQNAGAPGERRWARTPSGGVRVGVEEVVRVRAVGAEEGRRVGAVVMGYDWWDI
ncbi:hypothetical protein CERSUDRAFT_120216 [Gelatoporia subvermispora B]|uniref:F-box domain-containing protein n=1 Tax=Ceriporiopsis subvermispora (strain B) TaxID=914234 RepID=M2P6S1_CERS8|nr:hypothetical protein CERSUDRAFT_120216 [Gelatoporia subvermispora B]